MTELWNKATNILLKLFHKSRGPLTTTLHSIINKLNVDSATAMR